MTNTNTYAAAGVNIAAGQRAVDLMSSAVRATYGPEVLAGIGAFGGLFDAAKLKSMAAPVLVGSTDGVGTKTKVAAKLGRWDTIGRDLVNHCINDILVQGAEPLFFLDYVASAKLDSAQIATVVTGVAEACREAHFALLGGETAEMPGVYEPGELDLAGTIIGVVDRQSIVDGSRVQPGDVVLGLPSTGLHTNGFSLARQVLAALDWNAPLDGTPGTLGDALLAVHRPYLAEIRKLWQAGIDVRAMAHITGGGFVDNFPRVLPMQVSAHIQRGTWPELPIFTLIQRNGKIADDEMFHVFNMGLGMLVVIPADQAPAALRTLEGTCYQVGHIASGQHEVIVQ
jgi:phosphoribosylformylglycinamidine cyclo-ligase